MLAMLLSAFVIGGTKTHVRALEQPDPVVSANAPAAVAALFDAEFSTASGDQICSGVLIRRDWVLTAAHCVADTSAAHRFTVGFWVGEARQLVRVRAVFYPEWFRMDVFGVADIAVLQLEQKVPGVKPIPLARSVRDTGAQVYGYGKSSAVSVVERPLGADVVARNPFAEAYFGIDPVRQIAVSVVAREPFVDETGALTYRRKLIEGVCSGDSGGPLLGSNAVDDSVVVVGVVSYGEDPCWAETPGVYTRVSAYQRWIDSTIASRK